MMKKGKNEFLGLLCNLYIVAILAALPLYTGQGYWQLGNTKYILFRNITVLCLGCWLVLGMPGRLRTAAEGFGRNLRRFSMTDWAAAAYGGAVLLSAVCSSYGELAWKGYEGWFTGAFFQLLLVGIYFFVSRQYDGSRWPLYLGEVALLAVTVLGLLHRLGIDPLGLLEGWNSGDWEYSHMLSTLGNINWLCGYYSVALALLVSRFLQEERRLLRAVLYAACVLAFVLLGVQGSQGGLLILGVCVGMCVVCGVLEGRPAAMVKRMSLLVSGFCLGMPVMWRLMRMRGKKAAIVIDGNIFEAVEWYVWVLGAAGGLVLWGLLEILERRRVEAGGCGDRGGKRKRRAAVITAAACVLAVCAAVCCLSLRRIDDGFGSGRGLLWRIAMESFRAADWKEKLLGAGPDCYAEAVFARLGSGTEVWKGDHWEGAVFTNAHNELLSQLCNVGILGTVSYLAIFLTAFWQYGRGRGMRLRSRRDSVQRQSGSAAGGPGARRDSGTAGGPGARGDSWTDGTGQPGWLGLLAVAMYGAHSLISFQQVLNAPLLFAVLGLCEAWRRGGKY